MHEFSAKDIDGHMVNLDKYRCVPASLVGEAEGRPAALTTPFHLQGLRVHRHQCGLAMRQNRRKLHSARRPARPICRVWFTDPGFPLQPVREAGARLVSLVVLCVDMGRGSGFAEVGTKMGYTFLPTDPSTLACHRSQGLMQRSKSSLPAIMSHLICVAISV